MSTRTCCALSVVVVVLLVGPPPSPGVEAQEQAGWCCLQGEAFAASPSECEERGGSAFGTLEEATYHCRSDQPHPAGEPGWCCLHGEVFPAPPHECEERGGGAFGSREEADHHCQRDEPRPGGEPGWCCLHGEVFPAPPAECKERGGGAFGSREEAEHQCRRDEPRPGGEPGWCCLHGEVFPAPPHECEERGGGAFGSREEAEHQCRRDEPRPGGEPGWCCLHGEVFPAPPPECEERGGGAFGSREEAEHHCQREEPRAGGEPGWCCLHGEVFPAPPAECEERGGGAFGSREEAEHHCRRDEPHPAGEPGWCCLHGEVFPAPPAECEKRGGGAFGSREEAEHHCRRDEPHPAGESGWCCLHGEVFPAPARECEEGGGGPFGSREQAAEACRQDDRGLGIPDLKGEMGRRFVGHEVTVSGIFVRDRVPLLVTSLDRVLVNAPMPDDQFVELVGPLADELKAVDYGGAELKVTGRVEELAAGDDKDGAVQIVIAVIEVEMVRMMTPYRPEPSPTHPVPGPQLPRRFAVLFSGGVNTQNNHTRYWNDLKFMYTALIGRYGFSSSTMAILYADGKGLDTTMPVHYSATQANLQKVLSMLRQSSTSADLVFIFTTNHGGGFYKQGGPQCDWYGGELDTNGDEGSEPIFEKDYGKDLNGDGDSADQVAWDEVLFSWGGCDPRRCAQRVAAGHPLPHPGGGDGAVLQRRHAPRRRRHRGRCHRDVGGTRRRVLVGAATGLQLRCLLVPLHERDQRCHADRDHGQRGQQRRRPRFRWSRRSTTHGPTTRSPRHPGTRTAATGCRTPGRCPAGATARSALRHS